MDDGRAAVERAPPSPGGLAVPLDGARARRQRPHPDGSRVSTTTSCPALPSSLATALPMSPEPPVITIRMASPSYTAASSSSRS